MEIVDAQRQISERIYKAHQYRSNVLGSGKMN